MKLDWPHSCAMAAQLAGWLANQVNGCGLRLLLLLSRLRHCYPLSVIP